MSESEELRVLRDAVIFAHVTLTHQRNKAAVQRVIEKLAESLEGPRESINHSASVAHHLEMADWYMQREA